MVCRISNLLDDMLATDEISAVISSSPVKEDFTRRAVSIEDNNFDITEVSGGSILRNQTVDRDNDTIPQIKSSLSSPQRVKRSKSPLSIKTASESLAPLKVSFDHTAESPSPRIRGSILPPHKVI